jgi:hypothetical protein
MKKFIHDGPVTPTSRRFISRTPRDEHGADITAAPKPARAPSEKLGFVNRMRLVVGVGETVVGSVAALATSIPLVREIFDANINYAPETTTQLAIGALASVIAVSDGYHRVGRVQSTSSQS